MYIKSENTWLGRNHLKVQAASGLRAHVHQEDACGAAPVRRAEIEVVRGLRGDREAVLMA